MISFEMIWSKKIIFHANMFFRFEERTSQRDHIHFISGTSCRSQLGRKGKRQPVRIGGCDSAGNIIHELYHTIGKS